MFLWQCIFNLGEEKNQQITQVQMFIHDYFNLKMFRASLCPSSGEQTV